MKTSIILPTFNERKNLGILVDKIFKIMPKAELIIVDDNSPDGTGKIADELAKKYQIKVIHRKKRLGLSTAVVAGFRAAKGDIIGVIDADLSHPPEIIPKLIEPILKNKSDFVIGSRNIKGGYVEKWPFQRKMISKIASLMARPLTHVSDPMSGLFFLKKEVINNIKFTSKGYKIGLEVIVKGKYRRILEVPYVFRDRIGGTSKLDLKEYIKYLVDWFWLVVYKLKNKNHYNG